MASLKQRLSTLQAKMNGQVGAHRCPDPRLGTESAMAQAHRCPDPRKGTESAMARVQRCLDPRKGTESALTHHQTDGPAMVDKGGMKSYETAGVQYTNSKGFF